MEYPTTFTVLGVAASEFVARSVIGKRATAIPAIRFKVTFFIMGSFNYINFH
jgi:hypothetical protein